MEVDVNGNCNGTDYRRFGQNVACGGKFINVEHKAAARSVYL